MARVEQPFSSTLLTFLNFVLIIKFIVRILLVGCSSLHSKHTLKNGVTHLQPLLFTLSNIFSRSSTTSLTGMIINMSTRKLCILENHPMNLDFHDRFINFYYEFFEDDIHWNFMKQKFEFIYHISMSPTKYVSFESLPTYTGYEALKSATRKVVVPSDSSSSPH